MSALMRDGYKCVLTGLYDTQSCQNIEEIDNASISEQVGMTYTEVAHVFSESASISFFFIDDDDDDDEDEIRIKNNTQTLRTGKSSRRAVRPKNQYTS
ncbi:hypothetical protein H0H93_012168 [Arthromyces matolae]|nr:hypothetical protein H0H93_012168 [Arthromyces matolae]